MIRRRAVIFLMIGAFFLLESGCASAPALPSSVTAIPLTSNAATPNSTPATPTSGITPLFSTPAAPSPTPFTPSVVTLGAWIHSDRQTETAQEPIYEVSRDTVTLHFGANLDSTYTLYVFYDFFNSTKSEVIGKGTLKSGQEVSIAQTAAGGIRAFHLVVEGGGQQVTVTASVYCLWVD